MNFIKTYQIDTMISIIPNYHRQYLAQQKFRYTTKIYKFIFHNCFPNIAKFMPISY